MGRQLRQEVICQPGLGWNDSGESQFQFGWLVDTHRNKNLDPASVFACQNVSVAVPRSHAHTEEGDVVLVKNEGVPDNAQLTLIDLSHPREMPSGFSRRNIMVSHSISKAESEKPVCHLSPE